MEIEIMKVSVRDLADGFEDNLEGGVKAYGGRLDVRPAYQREFVYKDSRRNAVVFSVLANRPLNVFYWEKCRDGTYAVLDGQQRTISICSFVNGDYSIRYGDEDTDFENLSPEMQNAILDYECMIYVCDGTDDEILDWFRVINVSSEPLTDQELRNSAYLGPWLSCAKKYFSATKCPAFRLGEKYVNGSPVRQDFLETAIKWVGESKEPPEDIEAYMKAHKGDQNCNDIKGYYERIMSWIPAMFPVYRKEMKGLDWGRLYRTYKDDTSLSADDLEKHIAVLMADDDVTRKKGVYEYVLGGRKDVRLLGIRAFTPSQKRTLYERCGGVCPMCAAEGNDKKYAIEEMDADHILPWINGGRTELSNGRMLCIKHNRS